MSAIELIHTEPAFVECPRIDRCGDHCEACDGAGEVPVDLSPLATLAHNLAIAGALFGETARLATLLEEAIEELEDTGGEYARKRAGEICAASRLSCLTHNPEGQSR